MISRWWSKLVLSVLCLVASACSHSSPYPLSPVSGTVSLDGQALSSGSIVFRPVRSGNSANVGKFGYGEIQSDGSFLLGTYSDDDGAVVGDHYVMVNCPSGGTSGPLIKVGLEEKFTVVAGEDNVFEIGLTPANLQRAAEVQRQFNELQDDG